MALDFPNAPTPGTTFPGPNGALWQWDGEKWTAVSTSSTGGGGGASIVMQPSPPTLAANALWWDTIGGQLYVCYDDGVAPLQWVVASNIPGPPASQVTQVDVASAQRNVGRNLIHNSAFTIAQRGAGNWNTNGAFTADRWAIAFSGDAMTASVATANDAIRTAVGDESVNTYLNVGNTGSASAGSFSQFRQRIEGVRRLAGKTVIISFYAAAATALKLGVGMTQIFGTGGSPSASVSLAGQAVQLTNAWGPRYSVTFAVPSIAGKTLGTVGDDSTQLAFWLSAEATNAAIAGSIGVQTGTIAIWGVQLEIAAPGQTAPTPLEKMDAQQTLAVCQRFYQPCSASLRFNSSGTGATADCTVSWQPMRAVPTIATVTAPGNALVTSATLLAATASGGRFEVQATAIGDCYSLNGVYSLSADL